MFGGWLSRSSKNLALQSKPLHHLEWEINGEYVTAQFTTQFTTPLGSQSWFSIVPQGNGFVLYLDTLVNARATILGLFDHRSDAEKAAVAWLPLLD